MRLSFFVKKYPIIFLLPIIIGYFFFCFHHLNQFITADEHYWVEERIPQYWDAIAQGKWKKTLINDKPGVSLALLSGPTLLFHDDTTLSCQVQDGWFSNCNPEKTAWLYASFRIPIIFANALFLILIYFSIRTFAGLFVATASVGLMALSPYLLGLSQIINPDSLLWSSGSASLFAFLAYLKTGKRAFGIWVVFSLTVALLSKYTAIIIIFFLPLIMLALYLLDHNFSPLPVKKRFISLFIISAFPFFIFPLLVPGVLSSKERVVSFLTAGSGSFLPWGGYALLVTFLTIILFVHIPKKLSEALGRTINISLRALAAVLVLAAVVLIIGRVFHPTWDIFNALPFDIKDLSNARYYLSEPLSLADITFLELSPLVYGLPIATLIFALFTIGWSVITRKQNDSALILVLTTFIVLHLAVLGFLNVLAIPRYIILAFPIAAFLAAIGMKEAWGLVPKQFRTNTYLSVSLSIIAIISIGSLLSSRPYYANFANSLLPKEALISTSWGYGGYEAALYLNTLPDAKNFTVWSDYYGVCEFFVGQCLTAYSFNPETDPDYYVLTNRGQARYMPRYVRWEEKSGLRAYQYYDRIDPEWSLLIDNRPENFVKVFKVEQ